MSGSNSTLSRFLLQTDVETRKIMILFFGLIALKLFLLIWVLPVFGSNFLGGHLINVMTDGYDLIADNLVSGRGYRVYADTSETLLRQPGYVYVLAGIFSAFGKNIIAVRVANVLFTIVSAYLLILLADKLLKNRFLGVVAAVIFVFHPASFFAESRGGIESIFTLLLLICIMTLYKALTTDRLRDFAILGLAIGIAALFRSTPVLFPMFLFLYLLARGGIKQFSHAFIRCAVVSVVMIAVLSPWLVRNYEVAGVIGPRETVLGFSVYNGWYINNNIFSAKSGERLLIESVKIQDQLATDLGYPHKPGYFQYFRSIEDEVAFDRYLTNKVFGEYGEHPLLFARNSALNFVRFWFHGGEYIATTLNVIITLPLLLLAVAGIRTGLKEKINLKPILLLMAAIIVVHLPVLGVARHHVPFIPLLLLFSLIAVRRWIQIRLGKA